MAVHQCRLLVPQELGPAPIEPESAFAFDLAEPDLIDLSLVPDFPRCREDAVQLAKRQRLEVRLMIVGLRIARLQQTRDKTRFLAWGRSPEHELQEHHERQRRDGAGVDLWLAL